MALDLEPGDVYAGELKVLSLLGVGSFAKVYEVEVPGRQTPMALKLTREPVTDGEQAHRALREITILRSLTNPYVVRVSDCGLRPDGHIYLLMDRLFGETLDQAHDFSASMPVRKAVEILHRTCLGLAEPHAMGIVHRDLKPENVYLEASGGVKVLDFGLARSWDGRRVIGVNASANHMVVGTPHYSQPEQLKTRVLTPASDVYSLGMILYELLSGRAPFFADQLLSEARDALRHDPTRWIRAHAFDAPTPLEQLPGCETLPPGLVQGVMRCLEKDPSRRPPDAGALANILGGVLRELGVATSAKLRLLHPDRSFDERSLFPGSYRIGSGARCEIKLRDDSVLDVHAILEWAGSPTRPHLRPLGHESVVKVNEDPIRGGVELGFGDEFSVGRTRLAFCTNDDSATQSVQP